MSQQLPPNSNQSWNTPPPPYVSQPPYAQPGYPLPSSPLPSQEYMQTTPSRGPQFAPPPTKKPKRWPWVLAIFVALVVGYGAGSAGHSSTTPATVTTTQAAPTQAAVQPTSAPAKPTTPPKPTAAPKWTTTHTFKGSGIQKTATFTAPGDWKINWSCDLAASSMGGSYNIIIGVDGSDGSMIDPAAINAMCKSGNTSGTTEERQGGSVYLDINSEDNWIITVQELK